MKSKGTVREKATILFPPAVFLVKITFLCPKQLCYLQGKKIRYPMRSSSSFLGCKWSWSVTHWLKVIVLVMVEECRIP